MKEPNKLRITNNKDYYGNGLSLSHLSDTKKCHMMISSYGEITSASLTKTEVKRLIAWLDRWVAFKDALCTKDDEVKEHD